MLELERMNPRRGHVLECARGRPKGLEISSGNERNGVRVVTGGGGVMHNFALVVVKLTWSCMSFRCAG
jgi:hypothetical protein